MATKAEELLAQVCFDTLRPRTRQECDHWSEAHIRLSERFSPNPGRLSLDFLPFMRQPHIWFSDPEVNQITGVACVQIGKTTWMADCAMYAIAEDPGPIMYVTSTGDNGKSWVEREFQPRVEDCDAVRELKPDNADDFKKMEMHFKTCTFRVVGSNSPANLASRPIRYLFADEVDKWPKENGAEAPSLDLARARTTRYEHIRKIVVASTPTTESGTVWVEFLKGSQHKFFVPCPHCGHKQELHFTYTSKDGGLYIPKDAKDKRTGLWDLDRVARETTYVCEECREHIKQDEAPAMLLAGEWKQTNPHAPRNHISWQISALYSMSWGALALAFLERKDTVGGLHDFYNNFLGLPFQRQAAAVTQTAVERVRDASPRYALGELIIKPLMITMTVDVQQTEFWWTHCAWSDDGKCYLLDYGSSPSFDDLMVLVNKTYTLKGTDEKFPILIGLIDSGYKAKRESGIYDFCYASGGRFVPAQGRSTAHGFFVPVRESTFLHRQRAMTLVQFNDSMFKQELYHRHINERDGKLLLPFDVGANFVEHMTGEKLVEKTNERGQTEWVWIEVGPNHLGDCMKEQLVISHQMLEVLAKLKETQEANAQTSATQS